MDSPELNVSPAADSKAVVRSNEIIVAVPKADPGKSKQKPSSRERKRNQVIQFEEDERESPSSSYEAPTSLSDTCLKYEERTRQMQGKHNDSTHERSAEISVVECPVEQVPPTVIKSVDSANAFPTPTSEHSFDFKETFSNISTNSDSICSTSTAATSSSPVSLPFDASDEKQRQMSRSTSLSSSNSNNNNNIENAPTTQGQGNDADLIIQIKELKRRCSNLEEQVTTLTL